MHQQQHPPLNIIAALTVQSLVGLALFAIICIPAVVVELIAAYFIIPLNLSPIVLNVVMGTKFAILFFGLVILACFMFKVIMTARKESKLICQELRSVAVDAERAVRAFIVPVVWAAEKIRQFSSMIGNTNKLHVSRLHRVFLTLIAMAGLAIIAFIRQADQFEVLSDRDGKRVSQLIGPDGAVINVADDSLVTVPTRWYGEPVQMQMSNGITRNVEFDERGIPTVLARVP